MTLPTLKQKHDRFRQFLTIFDTRRNVLKFNETIITGNKDDFNDRKYNSSRRRYFKIGVQQKIREKFKEIIINKIFRF